MNNVPDIKNYSTYSCEMGMLKIQDITNSQSAKKSKIAFLTDHSTLSGAPEFEEQCHKNEITPVIGVVVNVNDENEKIKGEITLYAQNETGYNNLKKIVSALNEIKGDLSISENTLEKHSQGILALTGGFNSVSYNEALEGQNNHLKNIEKIFGKENVFLELQKREIKEKDIENSLENIDTKDKNIVITNENRFPHKSQHSLMLEKGKRAIGVNSNQRNLQKINKEDFVRTQNQIFGFYYKGESEPITNTNRFAEKFEPFNILKNETIMPKANSDRTLREVLRERYAQFIKKIPKDKKDLYKERVREELDVIENLGFDDYFLIFDDIIQSNKNEAGFALRGSSVGSLVVHILGMSDVDPVENGLLFERFLNKGRGERKELPDIDLETTDTNSIFNYISNKYGHDNVAMLMAHDTTKSKTQISLAYDVLKTHYPDYIDDNFDKDFKKVKECVDKNFGSQNLSMSEELSNNNYLKKIIQNNKNAEKIINVATSFDDQVLRHKRGNAGIVINNSDITNIFSVKKDKNFVISNIIEAEKNYVEKLGLIKLDILANKYLEKTLSAYKDLGISWANTQDKYQDESVYSLLKTGKTVSINQLKNPKQADLCKDVEVSNFSDLTAVVALLRPGVSSQDREEFVRNKKNPQSIKYSHPLMQDVLGETYGVVVYDEQIMKIAQNIGGLSKEQSDDFRTHIKKNNIDGVAHYKKEFINNAMEKNNLSYDDALNVYKSLEDITGKYTFTKAHASVYSDLIYKQTWLKANHPSEYIKHFLENNNKELNEYIDELHDRNISVLKVDINRTEKDYKTLINKSGNVGVDFSLKNILKNNEKMVDAIIKEREENGAYSDIFDYVERALPKISGLNLLSPEWNQHSKTKENFIQKTESLIKAGAFDSLVPENMEMKMAQARGVLCESLKEGVENALKPHIDENYHYKEEGKNKFTIDDVIKSEKNLYGFSLVEKKMEKSNRIRNKL